MKMYHNPIEFFAHHYTCPCKDPNLHIDILNCYAIQKVPSTVILHYEGSTMKNLHSILITHKIFVINMSNIDVINK